MYIDSYASGTLFMENERGGFGLFWLIRPV